MIRLHQAVLLSLGLAFLRRGTRDDGSRKVAYCRLGRPIKHDIESSRVTDKRQMHEPVTKSEVSITGSNVDLLKRLPRVRH